VRRVTLLALLLLLLAPVPLLAHAGGAPVLVDAPAGPYRVFAWLLPEPLRVGVVHLDVGVTLAPAADEPANRLVEPVTDTTVQATFTPLNRPERAMVATATAQSGLNGYYYEIETVLDAAQDWQVVIEVNGPSGYGQVSFERQVLPPRQVNWPLVASAGVGLLFLVGLMGVWNRLQARESV
jgi:hypothetical protein